VKNFLTSSLKSIAGKLKGENNHEREPEDEFAVVPEHEFELKPLAELDKIEFSPRDYEKTSDFQENICLYKEALEKIRDKYRPHILEAYYMNSAELIRRENFCRKNNISPEELKRKIDDFCAKNNILDKKLLYMLKEDVDPIRKQYLEQRITAEDELEKIKFLVRDSNCSEEQLGEGVALAKAYRSPEEAAALGKILEVAKAKGEGIYIRDGVKLSMTNTILNNIELDVNPSGERNEGTKYASNWEKRLELLKERLGKKGIYLDEAYEGHQIHEEQIKQTWAEINEEMEEASARKRSFENTLDEVLRKHPDVGFEYYCAVLEEQEEIKRTRGLEEYSKDAQKLAGTTAEDRRGEQITSEERMARLLLKTAEGRRSKTVTSPDIGATR